MMETKYFVLLLFLTAAAFMDAASFKVRNWLVLAGILAGLYFCHTRDSFMGLMIPFLLLLPLYAARQCGAADIKLLMMLGLYVGTRGLLKCALPILGTALLLAFCRSRTAGEHLLEVQLPFAVPVLLGTMPFLLFRGGF